MPELRDPALGGLYPNKFTHSPLTLPLSHSPPSYPHPLFLAFFLAARVGYLHAASCIHALREIGRAHV